MICQNFQVIVYTSLGNKVLLAKICETLKLLDPKIRFHKKLYHKYCVWTKICVVSSEKLETTDVVIKNIQPILEQYDLKNVIILDSQKYSYGYLRLNFIPFLDFAGDENDPTLFYLTNYLITFLELEDVRTKIEQDFYQISKST